MDRRVDPDVSQLLVEEGHTRQKDMAIPPVEIHPHLITFGAIFGFTVYAIGEWVEVEDQEAGRVIYT
jgi:hypothetical protein